MEPRSVLARSGRFELRPIAPEDAQAYLDGIMPYQGESRMLLEPIFWMRPDVTRAQVSRNFLGLQGNIQAGRSLSSAIWLEDRIVGAIFLAPDHAASAGYGLLFWIGPHPEFRAPLIAFIRHLLSRAFDELEVPFVSPLSRWDNLLIKGVLAELGFGDPTGGEPDYSGPGEAGERYMMTREQWRRRPRPA